MATPDPFVEASSDASARHKAVTRAPSAPVTTPAADLPPDGSSPERSTVTLPLPMRELSGAVAMGVGGIGSLVTLGYTAGWQWVVIVLLVLLTAVGYRLSTSEV